MNPELSDTCGGITRWWSWCCTAVYRLGRVSTRLQRFCPSRQSFCSLQALVAAADHLPLRVPRSRRGGLRPRCGYDSESSRRRRGSNRASVEGVKIMAAAGTMACERWCAQDLWARSRAWRSWRRRVLWPASDGALSTCGRGAGRLWSARSRMLVIGGGCGTCGRGARSRTRRSGDDAEIVFCFLT